MKRHWFICGSVVAILLSGFPCALAQMGPFQVEPDGRLTLSPEARQAGIDEMLAKVLESANKGKEEKVDLVRVIPLVPRVDSQVKGIDVVGYVLSDGTSGYIVTEFFGAGATPSSGLQVEADLETGTYTAREIPLDEIKPYQRVKGKSRFFDSSHQTNRSRKRLIPFSTVLASAF